MDHIFRSESVTDEGNQIIFFTTSFILILAQVILLMNVNIIHID